MNIKKIIIITMGAMPIISGCQFVPCGWLSGHEKDECLENNEAANSGGDDVGEPDDLTILVTTNKTDEPVWPPGDEVFAIWGSSSPSVMNSAEPLAHQAVITTQFDTCPHPVGPFACGGTWSAPTSGGECWLCDPRRNVIYPPHAVVGNPFIEICDTTLSPSPFNAPDRRYYPAVEASEEAMSVSDETWSALLECGDYEQSTGHRCNMVAFSVAASDGYLAPGSGEWTCGCNSDADCQPGAVCESGYVFDGLHPRPTLCTWDVSANNLNGVAPDGPAAYGLGSWADGIEFDITGGLRIVRSFASAIAEGAINDNQRIEFDASPTSGIGSATITACGPGALCEHLGLAAGDRLEVDVIDAADLDDLLDIEIVRSTGEVESWTIEVVDAL